jgi:uncharacterized protein YbcI
VHNHVGFFFAFGGAKRLRLTRMNPMNDSNSTMAKQIARAAIAFEQRRTGGHHPKSVTVVLSEGTLVITLHEALSPAERALAKSPKGRAEIQELHRQLFAGSSESLRKEISRITGMEVRGRGPGVHERHRSPSVPVRRQRSQGVVERE